MNTENPSYDYIVVGSGAGGGPLAANLARAGFQVLLLEAGGGEDSLNYSLPAFNGLSTEDQTYRWDYFVRHYSTVVFEMAANLRLNRDCTLSDNPEQNPCLSQWLESRTGLYTSGGSSLAFLRRSGSDALDPDVFVFALANHFQGYFPLYFSTFAPIKNHFTWSILKAHTKNTAGVVQLRSTDPLDTPEVNFHYFEEGNDRVGRDLNAVVDGVRFARAIMTDLPLVKQELLPGAERQSDEEIKQYIRDNAWGHHCSCTCKIGADDDPLAVLDSNFRVRHTSNLRVVDASVFPQIPGYFIVLPIYMISEKAADVIVQAARG